MKRHGLLCAAGLLIFILRANAQKPFTLEQVMSAPFPANLTAAKTGNRVAWTLDEQGKRNVWVAEGSDSKARKLTSYTEDDGGELSFMSFSPDANTIVYVRGEQKNPAGQYGNPTSDPTGAQMALWAVDWKGGAPRKIDEGGREAQVSAKGWVAYDKDGQIWIAPLDSSEKPKQIVTRGNCSDPQWSPDGGKLAFVAWRGDHAFIAIYDVAAKSIRYIAASVDRDGDPVWSLDGKRIAFVRRPAEPRDAPQGSFPYIAGDTGGGVINWAAGNQLVIASEEDGWQHLYLLSADSGKPKLLTPGDCEVEQWSFTTDKKTILFNSNCNDIDRRHLWN